MLAYTAVIELIVVLLSGGDVETVVVVPTEVEVIVEVKVEVLVTVLRIKTPHHFIGGIAIEIGTITGGVYGTRITRGSGAISSLPLSIWARLALSRLYIRPSPHYK